MHANITYIVLIAFLFYMAAYFAVRLKQEKVENALLAYDLEQAKDQLRDFQRLANFKPESPEHDSSQPDVWGMVKWFIYEYAGSISRAWELGALASESMLCFLWIAGKIDIVPNHRSISPCTSERLNSIKKCLLKCHEGSPEFLKASRSLWISYRANSCLLVPVQAEGAK